MMHMKFLDESSNISLALQGQYDLKLVLLSLFIAALASSAAFHVSEKIDEKKLNAKGYSWLVVASVVLGLGIWAMHFIAMLAFILPVEIQYDLSITLLSLVPAILASAVVLRSTKKRNSNSLVLLRNAILMGAGIGTMHYIGMAAMHGDLTMRYSAPLFSLSILVAVALSFFALRLKIWTEHIKPNTAYYDWRLLSAALVMGLAITAMHYTGMWATYFFAAPSTQVPPEAALSPKVLAWAIGIACINIIALLLIVYSNSEQALMRKIQLSENRQLLKANEELKNAQLQLIQSAKLASLGEISAGLAHELNQPLGAIRLSVQFIQTMFSDSKIDQKKLDEKKLALKLEKIIKQIDRATKIIRHLKIFSRDGGHEPEEVDINWVINEALTLFTQPLRIQGICLSSHLANNLPKVECDFIQIEQVLTNLISNARDALKNEKDKHIKVRSYLKQDWICVEIEDTGCGMPESVTEKIFDPFFTTKEVGKGTGLGMSISHGIVKEHMGQLTVSSTNGVGSCFTLSLPIKQNAHHSDNHTDLLKEVHE